ncbi:tetratricopeptide repeat protein [Marinivivus vitaminiproducens]|uniref:tetratricopeptide repeat protein n=1 Tax=Marinivivus vitaminiproducens TaxID=3035935 RepID=UPI002799CC58|nr:co-chaperone YbbN [Geminicoccaceae bacterium SCSIO 64248]
MKSFAALQAWVARCRRLGHLPDHIPFDDDGRTMLDGLIGAKKGAAPEASPIKDGDIRSFGQDVIQASQQVPVLVDFWAPWCGPCKQLTPLLEKVVTAAGGKVRLVKVNIDEPANAQLVQQLRIQSVPTVYAFVGGQPVDGFMGALPESELRAFIERLTGPIGAGDADMTAETAKQAAEAGDLEGAAAIYQHLLETSPEDPALLGGLARAQMSLGQLDAAEATLAKAPLKLTNHVDIESVRASIALAREAGTLPDAASLQARLSADPDDHAARRDYATALFLRGQTEPAIDELLAIVKRDREWQEDGGRKALVRLFEALGPSHPATVQGRRKLSAVLFA